MGSLTAVFGRQWNGFMAALRAAGRFGGPSTQADGLG